MRSITTLALALSLAVPAGEAPAEEKPASAKVEKLPEGMHGFSGMLVGKLVGKDAEKGTLVLQVTQVKHVWKQNKAKEPKSCVGKALRIEGVFGKFLDVLLVLKEGDGVEIETKHVKGDNLVFLGETLKKVVLEEKDADDGKEEGKFPAGLRGFRGILVGKVVSTDVEKGVLVFKMEKVQKVWRQNKAKKPEEAAGKELTVKGIAGKFLDVLLTLKKGDAVEVEAFHTRGEDMHFPGEWLKKVEAVKKDRDE